MRTRPDPLPLLFLFLFLLAACGPSGDSEGPNHAPVEPSPAAAADRAAADAVLDRAVEALGGAEAIRAASVLRVRMERSDPPPAEGRAAPVVDYVFAPPERLARRTETFGLVHRSALVGDRMWLHAGAAVHDLRGAAADDDAALRDDLLCLLAEPLRDGAFELSPEIRADGAPAVRAWRPEGAARVLVLDGATGRPARLERLARDGSGEILAAWDYSEFEAVAGPGSVLFPRRIEELLGDKSSSWRVTDVSLAAGIDEAAWFDRPDDSGPGEYGEITRRKIAACNAVAFERTGPFTDLARVDAAIAHSLEVSLARPTGPIVRVFDALPDEGGTATVTTYVPVRLSRDPDAGNLPRGAEVRVVAGADVLAAPYRGPYPRDRSVYASLEERARELGLVPDGAPRHVILSDPGEGEPRDLRQEIQLPVRAAD